LREKVFISVFQCGRENRYLAAHNETPLAASAAADVGHVGEQLEPVKRKATSVSDLTAVVL
jgi:hypothetical protein